MLILKNIYLNSMIALAYLAGGVIGSLLASEPSNSSPVWPSSGIALAVMLIYGWRVLPGLFIGIFCTQIYISYGLDIIEALTNAFSLTLIKAFASSAQAALGMFLIQRFVGKKDTLLDLSRILLFFFYGAIISCIVAPTICIGVFYLQNILTANDCLLAWVTWWVGDVIGVLIFTPIIFSLLAHPRSIWRARKITVATPLCFLLVLLVFIFFYSKQQETDRISTLFDHRVERVQKIIQDEINAHKQIAENIRDVFNASVEVTKDEFHLLTRASLRIHPDLIAIEWIPRVVDNPELPLSTTNKVHFPIKYVEPYLGNESALDYDITQNKTALKTLRKVARSGNTLSTGLIHLIQDSNNHHRVTSIIYAPLYKKDKPEYAIDEKSHYLLGFVAVVFSIEDEKTGALSALVDNQLQIEIKNNSSIFYSNFIDASIKPISFVSLQTTKTIEAAGNNWQISFRPSEQFLASQTTWHVWWTLLGGLLLTSFIGVGLLVLTGRTAHIEEQVHIKTLDLSATNNKLHQEMVTSQLPGASLKNYPPFFSCSQIFFK